MQNIQMQIEDKYLDTFLTLINSLKDGMVKHIHIDENNSDKEVRDYFQSSLAAIENGKTKLISHDEVWNTINQHIKTSN